MEKKAPRVAVIIVTYNSERHLDKCIACLAKQTYAPAQLIIVDSGSEDYEYLLPLRSQPNLELIFAEKECGFCRGNNSGLKNLLPDTDYIFFLNPDAFIAPTYIEKAVAFMQEEQNVRCGAITGITEGYCMEKDSPTGLYDTTGIFNTWWGRWFDRGHGQPLNPQRYNATETIPAICGALFFCRYAAARTVMLPDEELFDSRFYMYKEDIDLSLRLKKQGWHLMFVPALVAYHCRGWNRHRRSMPKKMRLHSAYNELCIHWRQKSLIPFFYSTLKFWAVKYLNL